MANNRNLDISHKILYLELKHRLPELLLSRVDKIGMNNSIEARVPFLDYRIVELAFNLPVSYKIKNSTHKFILKKAAEKVLPNEIIYRKKIGFCGSTSQMLTPQLKRFAESTINSNLEDIEELFNRDYINKLINSGNPGRIWTLLNFSLWKKTWF